MQQRRTISTIVIKPTKFCNAACTYCSSPPEVNGAPKWSDEDWQRIFDKLYPHLMDQAVIIWHGGEPMLMGPEFYRRAFDYARARMPNLRFSIQTNLLAYDSKRWRDVFSEVFEGSVSSSYDPSETSRLYKGSAKLYAKIFFARLDAVVNDGFRPKVLGIYSEETAHLATEIYDRMIAQGGRAVNLRFNYQYPAGRADGIGEVISARTYGRLIVGIYDRWIRDNPPFTVTPMDEMFKKTIGVDDHRCPWTRMCSGRFLGIEPDGSTYNCPEFADIGDPQYAFGNIFQHTVPELFASKQAVLARRRRVDFPDDCGTCPHFVECDAGCMREAVLFGRGQGGKFYYCQSWKMLFARIKQSIMSGEADAMVRRYGVEPAAVRASLAPRADQTHGLDGDGTWQGP